MKTSKCTEEHVLGDIIETHTIHTKPASRVERSLKTRVLYVLYLDP